MWSLVESKVNITYQDSSLSRKINLSSKNCQSDINMTPAEINIFRFPKSQCVIRRVDATLTRTISFHNGVATRQKPYT